MAGAILTIPCYNEERRLEPERFMELAGGPDLRLLFVNDGSTDGTERVLRALEADGHGRITVLSLPRNQGKAEAVRQGLLWSLEQGADLVGYADADLSTPVEELLRLLDLARETSARVLMGTRVNLLGTDIVRHPKRHYLGRVFATVASLALRLRVYDTQCGAKLFRDTEALRAALGAPFTSRWAFDVELLGRLLTGLNGATALAEEDFLEVPLHRWRDVSGSKLSTKAMARAGLDLLVIGWRLRKQGSAGRNPN